MKRQPKTLAYRWPDINWHGIIRRLLPTPGNVVFTLLVIDSLFWAQTAGAFRFSLGQLALATQYT